MDNLDVFAVLTARGTNIRVNRAFKLAHNARWFQPAVGGVEEQPTISSREPTPPVDDDDEKDADRLVLTFSGLMQLGGLGEGIRAGTDRTLSHILLGRRGTPGVSSHQYSIVIDDELRIWLRDRYSSYGTSVAYSGQDLGNKRVNESWLLASKPSKPNRFGRVAIGSGDLAIEIEFPNHGGQDPQYLANLRALVDKEKEDEGLGMHRLSLAS